MERKKAEPDYEIVYRGLRRGSRVRGPLVFGSAIFMAVALASCPTAGENKEDAAQKDVEYPADRN